MEQIHEGGCLCGEVRYQVTGEPIISGVCHCKKCQLRTGSAFGVSFYFKETQVKIIKGNLTSYKYHLEESGRWIRTEFCPICGTTVTYTTGFFPGSRSITGGTLDNPNCFKISAHYWTRSAHQWMVYPEDVPKYLTQPSLSELRKTLEPHS